MARTYKKDYSELDCLNCGERERVCTYNGECENLEPMTHQEFIQNCNTEELEHELTMLIMKDRFFADKEFAYVNIRFKVHCWLKEQKE